MNIIKQLGIILGITYTGEVISTLSGLPIPGSVIGMFILFFLLLSKKIKLKTIEFISDLFLLNLAFFFIPPGVGIITSMDTLAGNWLKLIFVVLLTTFITILITGWTIDFIIGRRKKND